MNQLRLLNQVGEVGRARILPLATHTRSVNARHPRELGRYRPAN